MGNKKFDKIKKTLAILLILCFVLSVTAASASAADNSNMARTKTATKYGYNKGYKDGKIQGQKDCEKYGIKEILQKIPTPFNK